MFLITGSAGFIGFHLAKKLLLENKKVIGIDNINNYYDTKLKKNRLKILAKYKNFRFYRKDLTITDSIEPIFKKNKIDYVVHLAAQAGVRYSVINPNAYITSNINGYFNILNLSKKFKVKHFVFASSSSVYGSLNKFPLKEKYDVSHPTQLYAATKVSNELMAHAFSSLYNLPSTGLRFFTVYGPYGRPDMSLFKFVNNIFKNKPITVFNKGNHSRDFTYIDDITHSINLIIKKIPKRKKFGSSKSHPPYRIINIGGNKSVKLNNYISLIEKIIGKKAKKKYLGLQIGDVIKTQACNKKIKSIIKFVPKTNLKDGLEKYITWFKQYYKIKND
jgi:UDP-glucuronate 4-epimerase